MWQKFKYLFEAYRDLRKSTSALVMIGGRVIILSLILLGPGVAVRIFFPENDYIEQLEIYSRGVEYLSYILSAFGMIIGVTLIYWDIKQSEKSARKIAKVILVGLPGMGDSFPSQILSIPEKRLSRESISFGLVNPAKENLKDHIVRFNSEVCVDVFHRFVLHQGCERLIFGGLTRIPLLVAYGSLLRNVNAQTTYYDKFRGGEWKLLDDEDMNISLEYPSLVDQPNESGDIGIAIGFSTRILKEHLPPQLADVTTIMSPKGGDEERYLIKNLSNLFRVGEQIKSVMDKLNSPKVKRVHLFLSVQSSLAIEIGRNFQEGTHRDWVIHNFDAKTGKYVWAIKLSGNGIEEFLFD